MATRSLLWTIPIAFGIASIALGQDANWDLRNYHLYNPWALLHHRVGIDLAPAGLPTYFNPLLDVPYYWMVRHLPPMAVAFIMGAVHGLNFLLLYRIIDLVLPGSRGKGTVAFLAFGGCAGTTFLSELGNTMGDNTTAVVILSSLAIALKATSRDPIDDVRGRYGFLAAGVLACVVAGAVAGLGIGLKLTNAPYGLGLLAGIVALGRPWGLRFMQVIATAAGLGLGILMTAGYWFVTMWTHFENPVFPQFNVLFGAPMAASMSIDDRWLPRGIVEGVLFPYVVTLFPMRISEIPLFQLLWPIVYTLFWTLLLIHAVKAFSRRKEARTLIAPRESLAHPIRFLLAFAAVSYLFWMIVFSVERYAIVLDLLLPLLAWVLLHQMIRPALANKLGIALVAGAALLSISRFETWGNADWSDTAFRVDVPPIAKPESATILVLAAPVAWIFPHFPEQLVYISFNGTFPESPGYRERALRIIASRDGEVLAIVPADERTQTNGMFRLNRWLSTHGILRDDLTCGLARLTLANAPASDIAFDHDGPLASEQPACRFKRDANKYPNADADNRAIAIATSISIADLGLSLDIDHCSLHWAYIGARKFPYQLCLVRKG